MGRVHQPLVLLLLATFLIVFSTSIEGRKITFGQFDLQKVRPESEGSKGRYVNIPFNSVYYPDSGSRVGFRNKGSAKDGSTRVVGEEPTLFLHLLPLPIPFPFPFPFGLFDFPNLFPFPFPLWLGGFPGGLGKNLGGLGGFPGGGPGGFPGGGPGGYLADQEAEEGKEEFKRNLSP